MTYDDQTPDERQERHRAETWRPDADLETILARLERNPDDPAVSPHMRMSAGYYRTNRAAAKAAGRDVSGRTPVGLDGTGGIR